jgi:RNA polymerase sigma factor (sigma-70 family)
VQIYATSSNLLIKFQTCLGLNLSQGAILSKEFGGIMGTTKIALKIDRRITIRQVRAKRRALCSNYAQQVESRLPEKAGRIEYENAHCTYRHKVEGAMVRTVVQPNDPLGGVHSVYICYPEKSHSHKALWPEATLAEGVETENSNSEGSSYAQQWTMTSTESMCNNANDAWSNSSPASVKRPDLTQESFDALLAFLDCDRERAGEKYEMIRHKLMTFFERRGCWASTEMVDETINRVAGKLRRNEQVRVEDASPYFYGFARNILKEYWRETVKELHITNCLLVSKFGAEGPGEAYDRESELWEREQLLECLESCLQELPAPCRELIIQYYLGLDGSNLRNRKVLAARLGITVNTLRIRAYRIRKKLKERITARL